MVPTRAREDRRPRLSAAERRLLRRQRRRHHPDERAHSHSRCSFADDRVHDAPHPAGLSIARPRYGACAERARARAAAGLAGQMCDCPNLGARVTRRRARGGVVAREIGIQLSSFISSNPSATCRGSSSMRNAGYAAAEARCGATDAPAGRAARHHSCCASSAGNRAWSSPESRRRIRSDSS